MLRCFCCVSLIVTVFWARVWHTALCWLLSCHAMSQIFCWIYRSIPSTNKYHIHHMQSDVHQKKMRNCVPNKSHIEVSIWSLWQGLRELFPKLCFGNSIFSHESSHPSFHSGLHSPQYWHRSNCASIQQSFADGVRFCHILEAWKRFSRSNTPSQGAHTAYPWCVQENVEMGDHPLNISNATKCLIKHSKALILLLLHVFRGWSLALSRKSLVWTLE